MHTGRSTADLALDHDTRPRDNSRFDCDCDGLDNQVAVLLDRDQLLHPLGMGDVTPLLV